VTAQKWVREAVHGFVPNRCCKICAESFTASPHYSKHNSLSVFCKEQDEKISKFQKPIKNSYRRNLKTRKEDLKFFVQFDLESWKVGFLILLWFNVLEKKNLKCIGLNFICFMGRLWVIFWRTLSKFADEKIITQRKSQTRIWQKLHNC